MEDTRDQYRTHRTREELLEVLILMQGQPPVHGELLDLSATGAGIRFDASAMPRLRGGEIVRLAFQVKSTGKRIVGNAVVQHRREDVEGRRYGFQFVDSEGLGESLDAGLLRLFNRRRMVRVRPDSGESVPVRITQGGASVAGTLANISETGLAVRLDAGSIESLGRVCEVEVELDLPGSEAPTRLAALVRYQSEDESFERWGLEFDEDPECDGLAAVSAYVQARLVHITESHPHAA